MAPSVGSEQLPACIRVLHSLLALGLHVSELQSSDSPPHDDSLMNLLTSCHTCDSEPRTLSVSRRKEGGLEKQFRCGLMLKLGAPEGFLLINTAVESKMVPKRKRYFYLYLFSFLYIYFLLTPARSGPKE